MAPAGRSERASSLARGYAQGGYYRIEEPRLSSEEARVLVRLRHRLFEETVPAPPGPDPSQARRTLLALLEPAWEAEAPGMDPRSQDRIFYHLARDLVGLGPIDVPLSDPEVEDISCDGVSVALYIHHRRWGSLPTELSFEKEADLDRYVAWLAQRAGATISLASPLLEATLPGGARLQATLGRQVTTRGSSFTIRRFSERPLTPVDLLRNGTAGPELLAYLWLAVEQGESFMVCGGTASGKTTTLNAALQFIPPERKVISIEDTRELNLPHENWVPYVTRRGVEGGEAIDMFELLTAALRQRPQYLVVGEVRGSEAYTVFQAMATGKTCFATFHAENVASLVHRMESPPIGVPRALIASLPLVLLERQVMVRDAPARRIDALTEIVGRDSETDELVTTRVFDWDPREDRFVFAGRSRLLRRLAERAPQGAASVDRELSRRAEFLERIASLPLGEVGPIEFARWLAAYAREPEGAMTATGPNAACAPAFVHGPLTRA